MSRSVGTLAVAPDNEVNEIAEGGNAGHDFWTGLTKPSMVSFFSALAVTSVLSAVSLVLSFTLSPRMMGSGLARYIATSSYADERCYITGDTLALSESLIPPPDVLAYGASSLLRAILDGSEVAAALSAELGRPATVINHSAGALKFYEMEALVTLLPSDFPTTVVIGINPTALAVDHLNPRSDIKNSGDRWRLPERWGLPIEAWHQAFIHDDLPPPKSTGYYFWDNWRFFTVRLKSIPFQAAIGHFPPRDREFAFDRFVVLDGMGEREEDWRHAAVAIEGYMRENEGRNTSEHLAILARVVKSLQARGTNILLLDMPLNPLFVERYALDELCNELRGAVRTLAREMGVPLVDMLQAAQLKASDFSDVQHVSGRDAVRRCGQAIVNAMKEASYLDRRGGTHGETLAKDRG